MYTQNPEELWEILSHDWLSDELTATICKTLARLPAGVQAFALENCTFIEAGDVNGMVFPASAFTHLANGGSGRRTMKNHYVILLDYRIAGRKDGEYIVAHEIAHALNKPQHIMTPDQQEEGRADAVAQSWGFEIPKRRKAVTQARAE